MKNIDNVIRAIQEGKEFYVPIGGQGMSIDKVKGNKVAKADLSGFFGAAKARFRKQNPIAANQADYVNWVIYDRISFAAAATINQLVKLFVQPIGTNSKTKVDTNLTQVSVLEAPQWFNATGLAIYFEPNAAPIDYVNFLHTEYMEFWVSQKVYAEGPLDCFPQSSGLMNQATLGTMSAAATSYLTNTTNGWPSIHNQFDLRLPAGLALGTNNGQNVVADGYVGVAIYQSQTFNVQLKADGGGATLAATNAVPVAGNGLVVGCRLYGILSRGVQ